MAVLISRARLLASLMLALAMLGLPHAAMADQASEIASIEALETLSVSSPASALAQLETMRSTLPATASYQTRRLLLRVLLGVYTNTGHLQQAYDVVSALRTLADAEHDTTTAMFAQLSALFRDMDETHPRKVVDALDALAPVLKSMKDPEIKRLVHSLYGLAYSSLGNFEAALTHMLANLDEQVADPHKRDTIRLDAMLPLSRLYINMKNPEKALETVHQAQALLATGNVHLQGVQLAFTEGIALSALGRNQEGLKAYARALDGSRRSGMTGIESQILGNIADVRLREHQYVEAEAASRQALALAERENEMNALLMAKANLGFSLGGQGKISAALPYIDDVIANFRKVGNTVDLESMLDEKGRMLENAANYKDALGVVREQQTLQREIFRSDRSRAVAAMQEQFGATERNRQIEALRQESRIKDADIRNRHLQQVITLLGAALTVAASLFVYLLYRRGQERNRKLHQLNRQLEFHAGHDPLTGMYNRRAFVERMKQRGTPSDDPAAAARTESFTLMDIDHFKSVNDTFGHAVGDSVLVEFARRLSSAVRDSDMVLRWGGEEFLIYSPDASVDQLCNMVERILKTIGSTPFVIGAQSINITMSAGFVSLPLGGLSEAHCNWEKAIQLADQALYYGKLNGRNRAYGVERLADPALEALGRVSDDLGKAVAGGQVFLRELLGPAPGEGGVVLAHT